MIYVALLRGINVGGNNKISMTELKTCLKELGYENVMTYINSGNLIFSSDKTAADITEEIETVLAKKFPHTTMPIKVLVLSSAQLGATIKNAPKNFGEHPDKFHSDAVFLIGKSTEEALPELETNPEVDKVWSGDGVIYFQRLSARRTSSRLSKIISKPIYKSMTIRSWSTVGKLQALTRTLES